ncbi:hypothetical protein CPC08DRAFT_819124 [Agrocybe pediades]|nr:hypothetical protein CPC08DRAFT_819124 [Agrocybe pediades]
MTQSGIPLSPTLMNVSHSIVSGGTFIQNNYPRRGERLGYARLLENVATAALHDSVHVIDPPKCYPNTRVAIIQNIIDWSVGTIRTNEELSAKPILWLKGGAGAGKSAIARSVAERCSDEGLLLGTFFFGAGDPTRNHVEKLVATISYQISIVLPEFRDTVATFIEDDPLIFNRSIRTQFSTLIVRPLSIVLANRPAASTATPRLIIIDGLDECSSINSQRDLLFTLQEVTNTTSHIRFLVCSRPESHLNSAFSLPQMSVEVMLADLHSIITISDGYVQLLHKSFADFLSEPQRAGDLYRDLSRVRLSHFARVISIFSMHLGHRIHESSSKITNTPIEKVLSELKNPGNMKTDFVTTDILEASQHFPTFQFFKPLLSDSAAELWDRNPAWHHDTYFIGIYFEYLYYIKDVCESTRLVYWEQMRQYCECILAELDDNLSGNWNAHFIYAYCHLLHDPRYHLPRKLSHADLMYDFRGMDVGAFGDTIISVIAPWYMDSLYPYSDNITKTSHDLIEDIKKEVIFAKSACFCLALLCDERSASRDADRLYGIARHDRRKKREHPWHWRQMVPRPPSLGNQLALIVEFREPWYSSENQPRLTRIRKVLRNGGPNNHNNIRVITMHEYFQIKSDPVPKAWPMSMKDERPQHWPLYLFFLDLLPYILPLAGRYELLVDMCMKKCFSSLSQFWPKKSRRARQAIESYLRRMDSEEGCE